MSGADAGWYADATTPQLERWWDGKQWTQHLRAASSGNGVWAARPAPAVRWYDESHEDPSRVPCA